MMMQKEVPMDAVQRQLLLCLAAYRLGCPQAEHVPGLSGENWINLKQLAAVHKLAPVVFDTLWKTPGFCDGDQRAAAQWKQETMLQAAGQAARSLRIVELLEKFRQQEIPYALVKGLLCRELYRHPDLRLSGDEDILVCPADRERCHLILNENGLQLMENIGGDDVTHWQDAATGLHIELHVRLFASGRREEEQLNRIYEQQLSRTVTAVVSGGEVQTFHPTYHFAFLVCHALKHFLAGGVGVRTLCDVLSFAEHYRAEIDRDRVEQLLKLVRGRIFLDQIFGMGQQWLGFDPAGAGWSYTVQPDPKALLLDCLDAGVYGQSSMSRKHSAGIVLEAAVGETSRLKLRGSLFPSRTHMTGRYPVLERWPVLLPVCWFHRLGSYALEVSRSQGADNSPMASVALGKKRMEMMVKYGVLPQSKKKN